MPEEGSQCICLLVILIDSVYRKNKNYYPLFLGECKYVVKVKKMSKNFTDEKGVFSDEKNSDEEN